MFLTFVASILSGVVPALRASGTDMNEALKDESRGSSSLRVGNFSQVIVVTEIALSFALLMAAGVMTMSIVGLKQR